MTDPEEFTDTDPRTMEVWLYLQRRISFKFVLPGTESIYAA